MPKIKEVFTWVDWTEQRIYPTSRRLPAAYQEVEYITSNWSWNSWQHIDIWYKPKNTTKIEFKISWWTQYWSYQIFWEDTNRSSWDAWCSIVTDTYSWNWPASSATHWFSDWNTHTWVLDNTWLYKDWSLIHSWRAWQTFSSNVTMAIFCLHRSSSYIEHAAYSFYYLRIYEWDSLLYNFLPCYRKSDDVIWLYDLVWQQFYTNQWSGSFSKGNDV